MKRPGIAGDSVVCGPGPGRAVTLLSAILVLLPCRAIAQTSYEIWPEVDLSLRLSPSARAIVFGSMNRARDTKFTQGTLGAQVEFNVSKHLLMRPGFWYTASLGHTTDPYREQRMLLDATLHSPLKAKFRIGDRNRGELRHIDGEWSWRYRNRLRLERPASITLKRLRIERELLPYLSGEAMYDSRYHRLNRKELTLGCAIFFGRESTLDLYVVRQMDPKNPVEIVNALGITWTSGFSL